jgi:fructose-1,6-bisphosphatase/inositol monophosphatase family enzyme
MLSDALLSQALDVALEAAAAAAEVITDYYTIRDTHPMDVEQKTSSADLVTAYDRKCEEVILRILRERSPFDTAGMDYAIMSEESLNVEKDLDDRPTWIVDPIDGTTSFVHGSFDCCVSIGLTYRKRPVVGVVHLPILREVFHAVEGRGAFCNGKPIHVSACQDLRRAIVCTHTPYNRSEPSIKATMEINTFLARYPVQAIRSYGSCAMDMCSVACGRMDLYFEVGVHAWDVAAAAVVIREAGGYVGNLDDLTGFDVTRNCMVCGCRRALCEIAVEISNQTNYRDAVLLPHNE